jgi:hypothetical protein
MRRLGLGVLCLLAVACGSSDDTSPAGGSKDAAVQDAGVDAAKDAPTVDSAVFDSAPPLEASADADAPDVQDAGACTLVKPYSSQNATCNACAEQHCCQQVNACTSDQECDDSYVNCILACALLPADGGAADAGIDPCLSDCASQYPKGKLEFDAAIGCAESSCSAECQ